MLAPTINAFISTQDLNTNLDHSSSFIPTN
jgi:hypothetical protein